MEYLVPLLIFAAVALVVVGLVAWLGRRPKTERPDQPASAGAPARSQAPRGGAESAAEASARLDQATHREIYRLIAQGKGLEAVAAYHRYTGRGRMDSVWDVQALAAHPQPWVPAQNPTVPDDVATAPTATDAPDEPSEPTGPAAPTAPTELTELTDLTIPQEWAQQGPASNPAFELEVVREDGTVRVSSADLPPWLRDQLTAMVRDGDLEPAAEELANHSVLTPEEALQFLQIMVRDHRGELGG